MADAKNPVPAEESALDQYVEREPGKWEEFLNQQLRRSPWWAISFSPRSTSRENGKPASSGSFNARISTDLRKTMGACPPGRGRSHF